VLQRYRAKELLRLVKETGRIETMPYELMLQVLDHMEIDGEWQAGGNLPGGN
jgi:hypothetical protein